MRVNQNKYFIWPRGPPQSGKAKEKPGVV